MSSSNFSQDGGLGVSSLGNSESVTVINPTITPGLIYAPSRPVDETPLSDYSGYRLFSSCEDPDALVNNQYFVGAPVTPAADGRYYKWDGSTLTYAQQDTTNTYGFDSLVGTGNMVTFDDYIYCSLQTQIVRLPDDMGSITTNWWTGLGRTLDTGCRHPMIVYEDGLYIANADELCYWDGTTSVQQKFVLSDTNYQITALGIDPGSGYMLVAYSTAPNASHTNNQRAYVGYYDGYSNKFRKVVPVEEQIESFYTVGSTLYVFYGQNLGFWSGSGLVFLRRLNIGFSQDELIYPCKVTNIGDTLYIAEQSAILAYGDIISGKRAFYYIYSQGTGATSTQYDVIANVGNQKLAFSYRQSSVSNFYVQDTSATGASDGGELYTLVYHFDRPITLNQVVIDYSTFMISSNTNITTVTAYTDNATTFGTNIGSTNGFSNAGTFTFGELPYPSIETCRLQLGISHGSASSSANLGIERIRIFYTPKD